ncbi:MAG TPA: amino acid permease [Steroidobacteraceae bacterium]|nr:amino acid permease [Steroidobacteraceae bacterium]
MVRSLGVLNLTAFGVGNTIGAGIFVLTGTVAALHAGPAVTLSFAIASLACLFAGLCYAEFAAMVPVAGSAYSYAYATFGELIAWIIGWSIMLEYLFSASLVAIGWSGYATASLADLGLHLPAVLSGAPFKAGDGLHVVATGRWIDLPAVLITLACTTLLIIGTRQSAIVNSIIVGMKVLAIVVLIIACVQYIDPHNWQPFIPANTGHIGDFGWSGVLRGAGIVFFAYIGFDGVSTLAEEAHNPQRTMPLSLFFSLAICTALYIAVSLVITGIADFHQLNVADPLYKALSLAHADLRWLKILVGVVAVFGLISVILLSLLGQIRIFYAMGRDGLLPPILARTNERFHTPHVGTLVTGALSALTAGLVPLDLLGELISIGTLMAFAMVCGGIIILRHKSPQLHRPFRTPWVPLIPGLGVLSCVALMLYLPADTWIRLAIWLGLGFVVYFGYGRAHSKLREER